MTTWFLAGLLWAGLGPQQSLDSHPDACEANLVVSVDHDRFSARFDHCQGRRVIEALERHLKVNVVVEDEIASRELSTEFRQQGLEAGLRRIFAGCDLFFGYGAAESEPPVLRKVWVYRRGSLATIRPVPPSQWAGTKDLEDALTDSDVHRRESAYAALMERPDARSRDLVLRALMGETERDEEVRQRLISLAVSRRSVIPESALAHLSRADASPAIRFMALDALQESPSATSVAERALADSDENVRQKAREILDRAGAARPN